MWPESVGEQLGFLRRPREISQKALAAAMRDQGHAWSQSTVWLVENDRRKLSLLEAADLAPILNVPLNAMLPFDNRTGDGAADAAQTMGGSLPPASSSPTGPGPAVIGGQPGPVPRRFQLYRHTDISHVSGIGVVAWGVQFPDGSVAVRWHGDHPSTVAWNSVEDAIAIHGHSGATEIRWLDDVPIDLWPAEGGTDAD